MSTNARSAAGRSPLEQPARVVAVLRADRGLAQALGGEELRRAEAAAQARVIDASPGDWDIAPEPERFRGWLGLLVLDGLLARNVEVGAMSWTELLGPGDLLQPWTRVNETSSTLPAQARWRVIEPTRMAVLDRDFAVRVAPWPEVTAALLARAIERTRWLTYQLATRRPARIDERVWMALWHLADRFGRVTGRGCELILPGLTHDALAVILGARRPTVSSALGRLSERGLVTQERRGAWLLHGDARAGLERIGASGD